MILWKIDNPYYVKGNKNNWRTWLRIHLPAFLSERIDKGEDCESLGSTHLWYKIDYEYSGCYHCKTVKKAQLWKEK